MNIFLADLGHNQLTISSDVYPLGVADLAAYLQAYLQAGQPVRVRLFREPHDLQAAIDREAPDVLGLSSYAWNHDLSRTFARYAKARNPRTLTLLGGPNFPLTVAEEEQFLREIPEIDVAVRGPTYEGERALLNLVRRFDEAGRRLEGLQEEAVPGNIWIDRRTGAFVRGAEVERIRDLDEIPSPYISGWMDPFFSTGYFPMMQIARGCPFTCAFCNSAVKSNNKVFSHSLANIQADLLYIARHVRPEIPLCFADDNFGMYRLDEEVADYIAHLQERFGWPQYIRTTTGKNQHERIVRVMRRVGGVLPMTSAVQSMDSTVLANIERANIKLEAYSEIQKALQETGMQSYGELILCLPGETKETFLRGVRELLDAGVKRVSAHQLMLLHGAPLSNPDSRARWGFITRYRVVARNVGTYAGENVVELEEVVVATPTFPFEDYLDARVFHLLLTIFYYEGNFEEAFELARAEGITAFELVLQLQRMLDQAPEGFRKVIAEFVQESQDELFESREECLQWAQQHFAELVDGTLGGNLLSKYSMLGRFYVTHDALDFLESAIAARLGVSASDTQRALLATVIDYLRAVLLHVPFRRTASEAQSWTARYDVEAWSRDHYARPLQAYVHSVPQPLTLHVEAEKRAIIESRIATFGEHPSGLGKFTRTMFARDLRRTVRRSDGSTSAVEGISA